MDLIRSRTVLDIIQMFFYDSLNTFEPIFTVFGFFNFIYLPNYPQNFSEISIKKTEKLSKNPIFSKNVRVDPGDATKSKKPKIAKNGFKHT